MFGKEQNLYSAYVPALNLIFLFETKKELYFVNNNDIAVPQLNVLFL